MKQELAFACLALLIACGGESLIVGSNSRDGSFDTTGDGPPQEDGATYGDGAGGGGGGGSGTEDADGTPEEASEDSSMLGGGPVDAGYYFGDGSFWVDGGAYKNLGPPDASPDGATDASIDASPGCAPLAACCPSLAPSSQSLCESVASASNTANCASELSLLQSAGSCTGVSILASDLQVAPDLLVSDGTLLFWTTGATPGLLAMPVGGGPITILLNRPISDDDAPLFPFLAVDSVNVYVLIQSVGIVRIPKNGAMPTLVNEAGAEVDEATTLGGTAYWLEGKAQVKSAPLLGNTVSLLASLGPYYMDSGDYGATIGSFGVTASTVFIGLNMELYDFPISGLPAGGPNKVLSGCVSPSTVQPLSSDTTAIYCPQGGTSPNLRIADDGSSTDLGAAINSSYIVSDATNSYWADEGMVGTIMSAPKAGGGTATVLARDANPVAIAVDDRAVYWSDLGGYIKSVPK